jgi:hypothetical protein
MTRRKEMNEEGGLQSFRRANSPAVSLLHLLKTVNSYENVKFG